MGTKRENVTLGLVPSIPKYDGFKYINNILYTDWLVKSHQELTSIQILFRNNEVSQAERASSIILMAQLSMTEHLFLKSPDDIIILLHFYLLNSFLLLQKMWNTTDATITRKHKTSEPHEWK